MNVRYKVLKCRKKWLYEWGNEACYTNCFKCSSWVEKSCTWKPLPSLSIFLTPDLGGALGLLLDGWVITHLCDSKQEVKPNFTWVKQHMNRSESKSRIGIESQSTYKEVWKYTSCKGFCLSVKSHKCKIKVSIQKIIFCYWLVVFLFTVSPVKVSQNKWASLEYTRRIQCSDPPAPELHFYFFIFFIFFVLHRFSW